MKDHPSDEVQVLMSDLEPFIPEPGDPAKILITGESQETVQVIDYYSNPGRAKCLISKQLGFQTLDIVLWVLVRHIGVYEI